MPAAWAHLGKFRRLVLAAGLAVTSQQAVAACDLAADLAGLHEAYDDLIEGGGTPRADIGRFVINRDLIEQTERDLIQSLNSSGFYDAMPQLRPVLDDMAALARRGASAEDLGRHRSNIESLTNTLRGTGCFETPGEATEAAAAPPSDTAPPDPETADETTSSADVAGTNALKRLTVLIEETAPYSYGILGMITLALCIAGWFLRRLFLRNRARAFPRVPFGGHMPITDALGRRKDRIVVDISQGGLMIERPDTTNFDPFDRVSVRLPDGDHSLELMWENDHFLGYKFDTVLTEAAFAAVTAIDVRKSEDRDAPNENSAPEGAAQQPA
ncbi:MAG: PilZ domain-containing protein [Pseudomonadota bacterium]